MSPKGFGGVEIPPRPRQLSHSETEDTPPSDHIRDLIRRDEEARIEQRQLIEQAGTDAKEARRAAASAEAKAQDAQNTTTNFSWKLNLILTIVGATFATVAGVGIWTLTQVQSIGANTDRVAREAGRAAARDAFNEERKSLREELKVDRIESIREYRRQEQAEVDRLVARASK